MTIWEPRLDDRPGPRYLAIVEALAGDIAQGLLTPGDRLPTHRDLAYRLGVTVGTVSRAYAEAERRGLVSGEVGRGTFVRPRGSAAEARFAIPEEPRSDLVDFSLNLPSAGESAQALATILESLSRDPDLGPYLEYQPDVGLPHHREAGARWVARVGLDADRDRVVVTNGAQHAMAAVLMTLARPGDLILTETMTYPGIKTLASQLHLRLEGLAVDDEGLRPDAFAEACRRGGAVALYCTPTLHNPTAALMGEARRREIADIAVRYGIPVVEDDVYGYLPERRPPPLAAFAPQQTFYLTSMSKSLAPGLRVGFVVAPPSGRATEIGAAVRATGWMATPLMAEIVRRWIIDGTAERLAIWQRNEIKARKAIAERALAGFAYRTQSESFHIWLNLPEPWRADETVAEARRQGVMLLGADTFTVGRQPPPHAVRLCVGAVRERGQVERGLAVLASLLRRPPVPHLAVV
jgi:DNA-binding transcriptional MocR family regulator